MTDRIWGAAGLGARRVEEPSSSGGCVRLRLKEEAGERAGGDKSVSERWRFIGGERRSEESWGPRFSVKVDEEEDEGGQKGR